MPKVATPPDYVQVLIVLCSQCLRPTIGERLPVERIATISLLTKLATQWTEWRACTLRVRWIFTHGYDIVEYGYMRFK